LHSFMDSWQRSIGRMKKRLLRVHRQKHLTEISVTARRVHICCGQPSRNANNSTNANQKKTQNGRKWDWEDETTQGWERYDDRVSSILEEAYVQNKPFVDFTVTFPSLSIYHYIYLLYIQLVSWVYVYRLMPTNKCIVRISTRWCNVIYRQGKNVIYARYWPYKSKKKVDVFRIRYVITDR
jgi:hypothetical protein